MGFVQIGGVEMLNIAIVGSVDHGKSTLIGRLLYDTGSIPRDKIEEVKRICKLLGKRFEFAYAIDALEEERKNDMTIECAQVFLRYSNEEYSIIDVPGHKEFLKNMATGVTQANAAILIIDAKEGITEQTKRHAFLLKLLGVSNIIVVINKMDLVNYDKRKFEATKRVVKNYFKKMGLNIREVIPISAYCGDNVVKKSKNMLWYKGKTVVEALSSVTDLKDRSKGFVMIIQDKYCLNGKEVYVGNILDGCLKKGDVVCVYPSNEEVKVEKILDFREGVIGLDSARAPKAVGIVTRNTLQRGNVLAKNRRIMNTTKVEGIVFCLLGSIKENERYVFRCATQETFCKICKVIEKLDINTFEKISGDSIASAEIGRIRLKFDKKVCLTKFNELAELGRFVLEKDGKIIAGGIIS